MPFYGELKREIACTISIDNGPIGAGSTAVTILKISRRDNIASAETALIPAGARAQFSSTAGARIDRMVVEVRSPKGGTVNVDVRQPTIAFVDTCVGDTDLVFETVP
jgi:hypothetical protein